MAEPTLGSIFKNRREELGHPIENAVLATNIRARVLQTFEESDFDHFPPQGYATGMLSSYARYLELDSKEILKIYEEEYNDFLRNKTADDSVSGLFSRAKAEPKESHRINDMLLANETGEFDTAGDIARATSAVKVVSRSTPGVKHTTSSAARTSTTRGRTEARRRVRLNDRARRAMGEDVSQATPAPVSSDTNAEPATSKLDEYRKSMQERYAKMDDGERRSKKKGRHTVSRSSRRLSAEKARDEVESTRVPVEDSVHDEYGEQLDYDVRSIGSRKPKSRGGRRRSSRARMYSATPDENIFQRIRGNILAILSDKRSRLIAIAVLLIVVALIIVASMLVHTAGNDDGGTISVGDAADSGESTSVDYDDQNNPVITVTTENGNPVEVTFEIAKGDSSLVQVICDDNTCNDYTAIGYWHLDMQVYESLSASFGNPSVVKVTENGETVKIPVGEDGTGTLTLNVQAKGLAK